LPSFLHTIVQMNPDSYYDIKDYPCEEKPGKLVLQRSSWYWVSASRLSKCVDWLFA
jgi:hypothetical protein